MLARSSLFLIINPFSSLSTIFCALQTIPTFRKYNGFSKLNEGQGQIQKQQILSLLMNEGTFPCLLR